MQICVRRASANVDSIQHMMRKLHRIRRFCAHRQSRGEHLNIGVSHNSSSAGPGLLNKSERQRFNQWIPVRPNVPIPHIVVTETRFTDLPDATFLAVSPVDRLEPNIPFAGIAPGLQNAAFLWPESFWFRKSRFDAEDFV